MRRNLPQRDVRYEILDGLLVRKVTGADGRGYEHRCEPAVYRSVAHALGETPAQGQGTSSQEIARAQQLPFTQVNVAIEFMKERGVAIVRCRRVYPASSWAMEDAMIEFHALQWSGCGEQLEDRAQG